MYKRQKYIIGLFISVLASSVGALDVSPRFSSDSSLPDNMQTKAGESDYLVVSAKNGLCGGFTLRPKPGAGNIRLTSYVYTRGKLRRKRWKSREIGQLKIKASDANPARRIKYDWAGAFPDTHYRIYCASKPAGRKQAYQRIDCSKAVMIEDIKHNVPCIADDFASEASYGSLGMNKGFKKFHASKKSKTSPTKK